MERFIVVSSEEAFEKKYPDFPFQGLDKNLPPDDYYRILYETDGEKPIRYVACDGGEPEDQTLTRDWSWVADELNRLAKEK